MKKTIAIADVIALIPQGAPLMIGGFMGVGTPERLIDELIRQDKRNLTLIVNDTTRHGPAEGRGGEINRCQTG
ncbi:MAG: CoA-transferase [Motiliproteus sp.]